MSFEVMAKKLVLLRGPGAWDLSLVYALNGQLVKYDRKPSNEEIKTSIDALCAQWKDYVDDVFESKC